MNSDAKPKFNISSLDVDQDVKSRLSVYMNSLIAGNSEVYVTPLINERNSAELIKSEFSSLLQDNKSKLNDVLLELEESNLLKFGPRSLSKPFSERKESILKYFDNKYSPPSKATYLASRSSLRPLSLDNALKFLKNNTNSGLPDFKRKSIVKERVFAKFNYYLDRKDPAILFTRTQESNKTRDVWGFPIADTLNEMRFYRPLLDHQKKLRWRTALNGPDHVDRAVSDALVKAKFSGKVGVSIDFAQFDASVSTARSNSAFKYVSELFQSDFSNDLFYIMNRFQTIGLLTPEGVISGDHGIPSGSTFTNEVGSITQYQSARDSGLNLVDYQIQGDDGCYFVKPEEVDTLLNSFSEAGLNINRTKSYVSSDYVIFLQRLYHLDYMKNDLIGGIYPISRALNKILYQERWANFEDYSLTGKDYYAIRTISILENCKYHPLFKEFVRFIYNLDKYKLNPSQIGINQYINMITNTEGLEGILYNQFGDNIRGIKNFETVKLIKSMSL